MEILDDKRIALTAAQMAQVDQFMIEDVGVDVLQLMELAGRAVAAFARKHFLSGDPRDRRVLVLAGVGNNGGDGLVAARLLLAWGARVDLVLAQPPAALRPPAARQLRALTTLGLVPSLPPSQTGDQPPTLPDADLLIDALLGFGLTGPPTGPTADLIRAANAHPAPILAVDLPSGLDATTGHPHDPCIHAAATLTLALPKTGLLVPTTPHVVGDLHLADIGIPPQAYARLGLTLPPLFAQHETLRIR